MKLRYIVVKNYEDIEKAAEIITNRKYNDYEIGVRFKVTSTNKFKMILSVNNELGKRKIIDRSQKTIVCNVILHRVYSDDDTIISENKIHHFDIIGSDLIVKHGIISNIKKDSAVESKLRTIYRRILSELNSSDTKFYKEWIETHDPETGLMYKTRKKKMYKIKSMTLNKFAPYTIIRKRD